MCGTGYSSRESGYLCCFRNLGPLAGRHPKVVGEATTPPQRHIHTHTHQAALAARVDVAGARMSLITCTDAKRVSNI